MAKKTVIYDASVIQEFAERLYSQAASIIFTSTFLGVIVGAIAGALSFEALKSTSIGLGAIIGMVVGGLFGFSRGRERAFKLKLEAQSALCSVQIEKNTSVKH